MNILLSCSFKGTSKNGCLPTLLFLSRVGFPRSNSPTFGIFHNLENFTSHQVLVLFCIVVLPSIFSFILNFILSSKKKPSCTFNTLLGNLSKVSKFIAYKLCLPCNWGHNSVKLSDDITKVHFLQFPITYSSFPSEQSAVVPLWTFILLSIVCSWQFRYSQRQYKFSLPCSSFSWVLTSNTFNAHISVPGKLGFSCSAPQNSSRFCQLLGSKYTITFLDICYRIP